MNRICHNTESKLETLYPESAIVDPQLEISNKSLLPYLMLIGLLALILAPVFSY